MLLDVHNQIADFLRRPSEKAEVVARIQVCRIVKTSGEYLINWNSRVVLAKHTLLKICVPASSMLISYSSYLTWVLARLNDELVDSFAEIHAVIQATENRSKRLGCSRRIPNDADRNNALTVGTKKML